MIPVDFLLLDFPRDVENWCLRFLSHVTSSLFWEQRTIVINRRASFSPTCVARQHLGNALIAFRFGEENRALFGQACYVMYRHYLECAHHPNHSENHGPDTKSSLPNGYSIPKSLGHSDKKLVLHFDARNTIFVADHFSRISVEQALNTYIAGVVWGKLVLYFANCFFSFLRVVRRFS